LQVFFTSHFIHKKKKQHIHKTRYQADQFSTQKENIQKELYIVISVLTNSCNFIGFSFLPGVIFLLTNTTKSIKKRAAS